MPVETAIGLEQGGIDDFLQRRRAQPLEELRLLEMVLQRVGAVGRVDLAPPSLVILAQFPQSLPADLQGQGLGLGKHCRRALDSPERRQFAEQGARKDLGRAMLRDDRRDILQESLGATAHLGIADHARGSPRTIADLGHPAVGP